MGRGLRTPALNQTHMEAALWEKKRTEPEIGRQNNKKRLMRRGELNTRMTTTVRDNDEQMTTGDESVK